MAAWRLCYANKVPLCFLSLREERSLASLSPPALLNAIHFHLKIWSSDSPERNFAAELVLCAILALHSISFQHWHHNSHIAGRAASSQIRHPATSVGSQQISWLLYTEPEEMNNISSGCMKRILQGKTDMYLYSEVILCSCSDKFKRSYMRNRVKVLPGPQLADLNAAENFHLHP